MSASKRRARKKVPVVIQMEALECGAASLAMILAYYGKWMPLEQVRADCGVSRDGSKAKNILVAARGYGLKAQGYRYDTEDLRACQSDRFPCIIHWNFNHFVVLCGFSKKYAYINDPGRGEVKIDMETFDKSFTGICLMFERTDSFTKSGKPQSVIDFAKARLHGTGKILIFTITLTLLISALNMLFPAFSRFFTDYLLPGHNDALLTPFLVLLGLVTLVSASTQFLQAAYLRKISGKLSVVANAQFLWKVLRLPMNFFAQRNSGELAMRQMANETIAAALIQTIAPMLLNVLVAAVYLVIMLRYSVFMTLIGVAAMAVSITVSQIVSRKRVNITRVQFKDMGKMMSTQIAGIQMIETLKASGAENGYFERWAGYQAAVNAANVKAAKLEQYLGNLPLLVSNLCSIVVLVAGIYLCIQGQFTAGMLFAFQSYMTAFSAPAQQLISTSQLLTETRTQMEQVEDVMRYPADVPEVADEPNTYEKLTGSITLKNVTFGYSRLEPPLLDGLNITIEQGQRVAFVGASGCGKSTISKLISGLYEPWSGEILYDGVPRDNINRTLFTSSVAVVDQDIVLFNDSISANIRLWDKSIEDFEVIMAARDCKIHDTIMQRSGGYSYKMDDGGRDFSGGQR